MSLSPVIVPRADRDDVVELTVDWAGYEGLLRLRGHRGAPRILYLDGRALLVTPSLTHEQLKERLGRSVTEVVAGLNVDCIPTGQTTFRRRARRGGVEGDLTYYFAHAAAIRGKTRINLRHDPPPDLAIEVVYSHAADAALETYRRLGVPEVWVATVTALQFQHLRGEGRRRRHEPHPTSLAFPTLGVADVEDWLRRPFGEETPWLLELRDWVRDVLRPRPRHP